MSSGWGRSTWGAGNWGQPAIQSVSFTPTGLAGTSALGTAVASIPKTVTLTGLASTGSVGTTTQDCEGNPTAPSLAL